MTFLLERKLLEYIHGKAKTQFSKNRPLLVISPIQCEANWPPVMFSENNAKSMNTWPNWMEKHNSNHKKHKQDTIHKKQPRWNCLSVARFVNPKVQNHHEKPKVSSVLLSSGLTTLVIFVILKENWIGSTFDDDSSECRGSYWEDRLTLGIFQLNFSVCFSAKMD